MAVSTSAFIAALRTHLGQAYVYGGQNVNATDCSGLIYYTLRALGDTSVPRTSQEQYNWTQRISKAQLRPGDLVFTQYNTPGAAAGYDHVGVYLGAGQVLQDPHTGATVDILSLSSFTAGQSVVGYGRVPGLTDGGNTGQGNSMAQTPAAAHSSSKTTTDPGAQQAQDAAFGGPANPENWPGEIGQGILSALGLTGGIQDLLKRAGFILLGGIFIIIGLWTLVGKTAESIA